MGRITEVRVAPSGVVIIEGTNKDGVQDAWYITEERLITALEQVAHIEGLVLQASKADQKRETKPTAIQVTF